MRRDLRGQRLQYDEMWLFYPSKGKNVAPEHKGQFSYSDMQTWTAVETNMKVVPWWLVGEG